MKTINSCSLMKLQAVKRDIRIAGIAMITLLACCATRSVRSQVPPTVVADSSLQTFLPQFEEGINRFINCLTYIDHEPTDNL